MPDFALEKAYDVTVDSLKKHGIKIVLVDLHNTLIAWNNPDGTPEMRQWLHDLRDAGIWRLFDDSYADYRHALTILGLDEDESRLVLLFQNLLLTLTGY